MKCPLSQGYFEQNPDDKGYMIQDCLKEECAWWDDKAGGCSVYLISRNLMGIFDVSVDVKEKMPHKGQFLR